MPGSLVAKIQHPSTEGPGSNSGQETGRVSGRKARGLQMEEIGCKCQTFFSLLSRRRKQTSDIYIYIFIFFFFSLLYTNLKGGFS